MAKVSLSIQQQIDKLTSNDLLDGSGVLAGGLMKHGYFRLSGYWRFFQKDPTNKNNIFLYNTDFSTILEIYLLDAELRNLLLEGLAEVEIAFRSSLVANMCVTGSNGAEYLESTTYDSSCDKRGNLFRDDLLKLIKDDINRSKERHVVHYRKRDANQIPLWVAVEALSFGALSRMYGLLVDETTQSSIAKRFGYTGGLSSHFRTNLRAIAVFRNVCAHHGRLWNRVVRTDKPRLFSGAFNNEKDVGRKYSETTWGLIQVLCHFVKQIRKDDTFSDAVNDLLTGHPSFIDGLKTPDRTR